jgi:hypothetical protein
MPIGSFKLSKQGLPRLPQSGSFPSTFEVSSDALLFGAPALKKSTASSSDFISLRRGFSNLFPTNTESTGQGTIEFWYRRTGAPASNGVLFDIQEVSTEIAIVARTTGGVSARCRFGATTVETSIGAISVNTWTHIAITLDDNRYLTLWVNGSRIATVGNGTDTLVTSGGNWWRLGTSAQSGVSYYREFRVSRNIRYNRANSTYIIPTGKFVNDSETHMLFHLDGTDVVGSQIFDDNGYKRELKQITAQGNAQISTAQSKFGGSSALFDGTGDYLIVNNVSNNMAWGTGDFTIEMWFYLANTTGNKVLWDQRPVGLQGAYSMIYVEANAVRYYVSSAARITSSSVSSSTWYHLVVSRSGNQTKMFLNGTQAGSTWTDSTNYLSATNAWIGLSQSGSTNPMNGYIDEVRLSNTARYTANFTAPTSAFVNDGNTLLLIHADGTNASTVFVDDNESWYVPNSVKFGTTSTSGYYADTSISEFVTSSNSGATIAFWARPTKANHSGSEWWCFMLTNTDGSNASALVSIKDNGDLRLYRQLAPGFQDFTNLVTNAFPTANQWYHVAIALNCATQVMQVYINGVARTTNGTLSTTNNRWDILNGIYVGGTGGTRDGRGDILTQLWADNSFVDLSTNINKFYNNGFVDMGSNGTGTGLIQPLIYHNGSTTSSPAFFTSGGRTSGEYISYNLLDNDAGTISNG